MSNKENEVFNESYFDAVEEAGQRYKDSLRKKPYDFIEEVNNYIFGAVKNINK